MSSPLSQRFVIRDGTAGDLPACVALDHTVETDVVLQMKIYQPETNQWEITLREERLPRKIEIAFTANERRLRAALSADQCFLIAASSTTDALPSMLFGYLTLRPEPLEGVGMITDIVVARPYRRSGIGARLLNVARRWAKEHDLTRLMLPVQTKNAPGVRFCQASGFSFCGFNDRHYPNQDIAVFFTQSVR
ncbi:MAG: GNAT family N-acetyltransferase [Chloroflexota bacterium]|nr:GNAT family N-acetyltransferase [Chloroflexota bacterium]